MERVAHVLTRQGSDWSALINATAERHSVPPRLLCALTIAECGLDETCEPGVTQGMARYGVPPDVSFGPGHQAVQWAPYGDQSHTSANIEACRQKFCGDLPYAFDVAAQQLAHWWRTYGDPLEALGRYNWPARGYQGNPNAANIRQAWERSAAYVVSEEAPVATYVYPFTNNAQYGRAHWDGLAALDIFDDHGAPIRAPTAGYCVRADYPLGGHTIHLYHDDGYVSYWAHLVQGSGVSGRVEPGQVMGRVGNTGNAATTPPHCHLAIATQARGIGSDGAGEFPPWEWLDAWRELGPPEEGEDMERVAALEAEVARLNDVLAAEKSWSGAIDAHVVKPGFLLLEAALEDGDLDRARQRGRARVIQVRDLLAQHGGVPDA